MNKSRREGDEGEDSDDFDHHHEVVGVGGFFYAADENYGEKHDDDEGGPVEAEVPARAVDHVALQIRKAAGEIGGRDPFGGGMQAEPVEEVDQMGGEPDADGHGAYRGIQD